MLALSSPRNHFVTEDFKIHLKKEIDLTLVGPFQLQICVNSGNSCRRVRSVPWEVQMSVWAWTNGIKKWNYNLGKEKQGQEGQQVSAGGCWAPLGCAAGGGWQSSVM